MLKKPKFEVFKGQRSMQRIVCRVQLRYMKRAMDLMLILGFDVTINHLARANIVHWYGHVLKMEDGHVLRSFDLEVNGHRKKVAEEVMEETGCGKKYEGCFEEERCTLVMKVECWC